MLRPIANFPVLPLLLAALFFSDAGHTEPLQLEECRINAGPGYPGIKARCGTLLRPENPADPDSGEIALRVAVVPALNLNPDPDPVVPLAGGPGQGVVQFYSAYSWAFEDLRRNRDILLVDQRGTGESSRMDCPFDDDIVDGSYSIELTVEFTKTCLEQLPHDPRYFTTSVAVTDLEAVREALGYERLNLYGVSYGSRVAAPPQISLGPEIATESQKALDKIFERCLGDDACNARFPDLAETFASLVEQLRDEPVAVEAPHPNTGRLEEISFGIGEFAGAVRLLAYHPNTMALLPLLVHEASLGNFVPLASQYRMTAMALNDMLSLGMHNAVMCTEDVPFYDKTTIDYEGLAASYMGMFQLDALEAMCSVWPEGPIDSAFKVPLATDIPVLLLSGDADPITPPRYAELAAVDLSNARHLVGEGQGHGQITVGCTRRLVAEFVAAADPGVIDKTCLDRSFVMPFFLDFSGPQP